VDPSADAARKRSARIATQQAGATPLHEAARNGHWQTVEMLVDPWGAGAVDDDDNGGGTGAGDVGGGKPGGHLDCRVGPLPLHLGLPADAMGRTPLHFAFASACRARKTVGKTCSVLLGRIPAPRRQIEWRRESSYKSSPLDLCAGGGRQGTGETESRANASASAGETQGARGPGFTVSAESAWLPDSTPGPGWALLPPIALLVLTLLADASWLPMPWFLGCCAGFLGALMFCIQSLRHPGAPFAGDGGDPFSLSLCASSLAMLGWYAFFISCMRPSMTDRCWGPLRLATLAAWTTSVCGQAVCVAIARGFARTARRVPGAPRATGLRYRAAAAAAGGDGTAAAAAAATTLSDWRMAVWAASRGLSPALSAAGTWAALDWPAATVRGGPGARVMCTSCRALRDERGHHCHQCGTCAPGVFDHHCPFGGGCVASGNHLAFVAFVAGMALAGLMFLVLVAPDALAWSHGGGDDDGWWNGFGWRGDRGALARGLYAIPFTFAALGLAGSHTVMLARNVSTYEMLKWRQLPHMSAACSNSRDNLGIVGNCLVRAIGPALEPLGHGPRRPGPSTPMDRDVSV
jgi:hypothetical protein